jgi:acetyltransferase
VKTFLDAHNGHRAVAPKLAPAVSSLAREVNDEIAVERYLGSVNIEPYAMQYARQSQLQGGTIVTIRPIRPQDENKLVAFHQSLSDQSVYLRYCGMLRLSLRILHDQRSRLCFIEYGREMALVAEKDSTQSAASEIIAVGRFSRLPGTRDAEYSILVTDRYQHQGLGTEISRRLIDIARDWKLERIVAEVLPQNWPMQRTFKTLGFSLYPDGGSVRAIKVFPQ